MQTPLLKTFPRQTHRYYDRGMPQASTLVDSVFTGGPILTMDAAGSRAEAVAVNNGCITAVGSAEEIEALTSPHTEVVDLDGRTMAGGSSGFTPTGMRPSTSQ